MDAYIYNIHNIWDKDTNSQTKLQMLYIIMINILYFTNNNNLLIKIQFVVDISEICFYILKNIITNIKVRNRSKLICLKPVKLILKNVKEELTNHIEELLFLYKKTKYKIYLSVF